MKPLQKIKAWRERKRLIKQAEALGFPMVEERYWYCGRWHMFKTDLYKQGIEEVPELPIEGKFMFDPFECGLVNPDKSALRDGLIPAIRRGNSVGLYRVARERRPGCFYDGALWDNGYKIDLELVRIEED